MELLLITLLLVKHTVADFFLQRSFMFKDKHVYLGKGGIIHAAIHGSLTFAVLILCVNSFWLTTLLALLDMILHYHIDYLKSNWNVKTKASPSENRYWYAFGLDQLAHFLTYSLIVYTVYLH